MDNVDFKVWYEDILDGKWKMGEIRSILWNRTAILIEVFTNDNRLFDRPLEYKLLAYTGLKDSKGKKIYDGAIVWWGKNDYAPKSKVFFNDGAFWVSNLSDDSKELLFEVLNGIEIIGNIYENPDLLTA